MKLSPLHCQQSSALSVQMLSQPRVVLSSQPDDPSYFESLFSKTRNETRTSDKPLGGLSEMTTLKAVHLLQRSTLPKVNCFKAVHPFTTRARATRSYQAWIPRPMGLSQKHLKILVGLCLETEVCPMVGRVSVRPLMA